MTMSGRLVAYFSATGTTAKVAEALAGAIGADLYEIEPAVRYTPADLDWHDSESRSSVEMADKASRPALKGSIDTSGYDVIYVGFPIWWSDAPRIVDSFLDAHDLHGKRVAAFVTSGGSPIGDIDSNLKSRHPDAEWRPGRRFSSADAADLKDWAEGIRSGGSGERSPFPISDTAFDGGGYKRSTMYEE